ncbi:MAG: hypothetical protein P8Y63_15580, partial [Deltaproteobacteria bacterium]
LYGSPRAAQEYVPLGVVRGVEQVPLVEIRNPARTEDRFDYLGRGLATTTHTIIHMKNPMTGLAVEQANPGDRILLTTSPPATDWEVHALLRKADG